MLQPGERAQVKQDADLYSLSNEVVGNVSAGTGVFISMGPQDGKFAVETDDGQMGWIKASDLETEA